MTQVINVKSRLTKSVIYQLLNVFISGFIAIAIVPIIIKNIGKTTYGIWEIILSLEMVNSFFELGFGSAVVKYTLHYIEKGKNYFNKFLWTFIYIKLSFTILIIMIVVTLGFYFEKIFNDIPLDQIKSIKTVIAIYSVGLILRNIAGVFDNIIKGMILFHISVFTNLASRIIYFLLVIVVFKYHQDAGIVELAVISFIVIPLITGAMILNWIRIKMPELSLIPSLPSKKIIINTFSFWGRISLISVIAQINSQGLKLILGMITNPVAVAYFAIANKVKAPLTQINSSLLRPLVPAGSQLAKNDKLKVNELLCKIAKMQSLIIVAGAVLLILYIRSFIMLWLGQSFTEVIDVVKYLMIPVLFPSFGALLMFYYSEGKTRISLFLNSFATVSVITLSLILQHYYGLMGFVLGIAISGVVTSMIGVILYCKNYKMKISEYLKNAYLQTYLCVLVMYLGTKIILNYVDAVNWFLFVGLCAISISIYIVCLFIIIPKKEMKRMINMVVRL